MGGELEKVIPSSGGGTAVAERPVKGKGTSTPGLSINTGSIRIHQNNGEAHFHDDVAGLKVAVPIPEFIQQYLSYIQSPDGDLLLVDWSRMTVAILTYTEEQQGQIADATMSVRLDKINTGNVAVKDDSRGHVTIEKDKTQVVVNQDVFAERLNEIVHGQRTAATFIDSFNQTRAVVTKGAGTGAFALQFNTQKVRATGALAMLNDFVEGR